MFERNRFVPKSEVLRPDRPLPETPRSPAGPEPKQQRMMVIALALLLVALGFVLYRDREFWFPETQDTASETQPARSAPAPAKAAVSKTSSPVKSRGTANKLPTKNPAPPSPAEPPATAAISRTVLPPLEVEVVAGNVHRTIHPGMNSVRVDLQPAPPAQVVSDPTASATTGEKASLTNAAEHVQMSADTSAIVSQSVKPGYPVLARQMKVQGSVILQALISRDGDIQGLQVVSGPPILAGAAREAVKQWRFKPHYQGAEAVETQAKITVNFTISTN